LRVIHFPESGQGFFGYRMVKRINGLPGTALKDCATCPEMVVIPAGTFIQGALATGKDSETNEGPGRLVAIDYALAVSRYEITKAQFARLADETGHEGNGCRTYDGSWRLGEERSWQAPGFKQHGTHPVTCVSWNDAHAYLRWLADRTGREYRLLSASEWEYAARAGIANSGTAAAAPTDTCESANVADRSTLATYPGWKIFDCRDDFVHTAPVGSFQANAFGLHDMIGNVFEWVTDCWNDNYEKAPLDAAAWENGDCGRRVLRGGSWFTPPGYVRAMAGWYETPNKEGLFVLGEKKAGESLKYAQASADGSRDLKRINTNIARGAGDNPLVG
jgi:formylglycine-generating enzyme required for sulfatase activity